jgi:hypothetical protein
MAHMTGTARERLSDAYSTPVESAVNQPISLSVLCVERQE